MTALAHRYQEMAALVARLAVPDGDHDTAIDGFFCSYRSAPSPKTHTAQWPVFALVLQGEKCLALGNEEYHYGVGTFLLVTLDLPVVSRITQASPEQPLLGVGMSIRPDRLRELLERIPLPPQVGAERPRGVSVNTACPDLLDATLRMLRLLERPADIAAMAPLIEQEILYRLLVGPCGPNLLRIAQEDSPSNRIAKAIAWLRQHYAEPLRIEDLARQVNMSVSSLHHHFSAVAAMTPLQYQKQLRLREARRLMVVERMDVGAAGYRVGYQSPSQFSREYSRLYGRSPRSDLAEQLGLAG
ncbi:AraC family transcriptional regulator [Xanthomonas sacchari]|uniref:AraC family transcriptional regulator n=1 Tax=Xanthomonas sacchari TaxID=56458 RepID=UPI00225BC3DB|nr:AraC family transcriptional regulator [Xanthomonas sacchari]MCW0449327.1 HTH-type transcriptional activator RhaS [Xanthomonas sacchari]